MKSLKTLWLIACSYDEYCQGYERNSGYWLVYADSFEQACEMLRTRLIKPDGFINCTVGEP
jgi:hypothetical protein